jgi:tetratricopeptide (TPR) repeat protein
MLHQDEEKARLRRERTREAIALAMDSRWEEAVAANQSILQAVPTDVDALNRLGRALMELGRYGEAKAAYEKALESDPVNGIARKNLLRLAVVKEAAHEVRGETGKVAPHLFVGEEGKVGVVVLNFLAPKEVVARMAVGDEVVLKTKRPNLVVVNGQGEYLGTVESRHGLRLVKLMKGGNKYTAAIASLNQGAVKVVIREVFRHPVQAGRPSFPARVVEGFRPYVRDSMIRYERGEEGEDEDEYAEEAEVGAGGHVEEVLGEGPLNVFEAPVMEEGEEEE